MHAHNKLHPETEVRFGAVSQMNLHDKISSFRMWCLCYLNVALVEGYFCNKLHPRFTRPVYVPIITLVLHCVLSG